jgi:GNAT superfamily N-acetyltransferase
VTTVIAPPPGYSIRPARAADLPILTAIERAAGTLFDDYGLADAASVTTPAETLAAGLDAGHLWVATTDDQTPVGFALAAVVGEQAHLDELDVHPDHGRRGLGAALIDAVAAWARAAGFTALTLTTFRDVPWNAPYYERLGFRIVEGRERSAALTAVLAAEAARGLAPERRVAMRKDLT